MTHRRRKNTCTLGAVPPHGICDQGLYHNPVTWRPQWSSDLHCYQDASNLCCCRPSSVCQGCTAAYKETLQHFTAHRNHIVRYASHEWSGTYNIEYAHIVAHTQSIADTNWCDICFEQTLMKATKLEGWLSRGRIRNSFFGHKCWVFTPGHFSDVAQCMQEDASKHAALHRDLAKTHMKLDAEAVKLTLKWSEENMPFNNDQEKELLMSSQQDSQAQEMTQSVLRQQLMEMQIKLDGQSGTSTMDVKSKVKALSSLRKLLTVNESNENIYLDSLML